MSYERIKLEYEGNIAVLKFNHPEVMNAVGARMLTELQTAVRELRDRGPAVRCLLITGEGRGFCAGANLADEERTQQRETQGAGDGLRTGYHPLLLGMRDLEVPIVTAVNGAAAGVGMSFALMGDIVCAGRSAFFLQAFARIGLIPDGGATYLLPRLVGWARAKELSLLADRLPAEQALEWGLINRVFDDEALVPEAMKIAERLAKGPRSLALIRKAYWQSAVNSYEAQLDLEAQLQNQAGWSTDFKEGVSAFLEKRDAAFTGQ
ncbi:MAG: 1,2-epoxyphenylacetyl-CoA isomerase [Pseudomonadota bacterium]|jgi:2-(1,2-epoxy-1,2-dihydrophenyl)acetyl-CoA isomerase|nr:enoyl-CoA hydratase/isomerase [Pseudomonadota bacterium]